MFPFDDVIMMNIESKAQVSNSMLIDAQAKSQQK